MVKQYTPRNEWAEISLVESLLVCPLLQSQTAIRKRQQVLDLK